MFNAIDARAVVLGLFLAAGATALSTTSAYACHELTGWCCTVNEDGHALCCYEVLGAPILSTCHWT